MSFSAAPSHARSCASVRRRGQHLGGRAGRVGGAVAQPGGDGGRCRGEARRLGRAVRLVDLGRRVDVVEPGSRPGPDDRSVLQSRRRPGHRAEPCPRRVGDWSAEVT